MAIAAVQPGFRALWWEPDHDACDDDVLGVSFSLIAAVVTTRFPMMSTSHMGSQAVGHGWMNAVCNRCSIATVSVVAGRIHLFDVGRQKGRLYAVGCLCLVVGGCSGKPTGESVV